MDCSLRKTPTPVARTTWALPQQTLWGAITGSSTSIPIRAPWRTWQMVWRRSAGVVQVGAAGVVLQFCFITLADMVTPLPSSGGVRACGNRYKHVRWLWRRCYLRGQSNPNFQWGAVLAFPPLTAHSALCTAGRVRICCQKQLCRLEGRYKCHASAHRLLYLQKWRRQRLLLEYAKPVQYPRPRPRCAGLCATYVSSLLGWVCALQALKRLPAQPPGELGFLTPFGPLAIRRRLPVLILVAGSFLFYCWWETAHVNVCLTLHRRSHAQFPANGHNDGW